MYLPGRCQERSLNLNADPESIQSGKANVAAVLVNWRQPHRTIAAVRAMERQTVRPVVVVVDNGSGDDSVSVLRAALPDTLIMARDENGGFGAGCNAGIECARAMGVDYVWLLNNDAVPEERCLEYLLAKAARDPATGAVGARIREPKGTVVDHAGCVMSPLTFNCRYTLSESEIAANRYAWITGASMLLSMRAIKKVGAFDTRYFMYWEDADLCHRLRRAGFTLAIAQQALVEHEAGTSSNQMRILRYQWHLESQLRWVKRSYSTVIYGTVLVYLRHFAKSLLTRDRERLLMTAEVLKRNLNLLRICAN